MASWGSKSAPENPYPRKSRNLLLPSVLFTLGLTWLTVYTFHTNSWPIPSHPSREVYLPDLGHLGRHCQNVSAIGASEYNARQAKLAKALYTLNGSAYIAEPGANTQFFGNFSKSQWKLSERPLLLIISPETSEPLGSHSTEIRPRVTLLTPKFEATRAKMLPIPSADGIVHYIEWAEEEDPYSIALSVLPLSPTGSNKPQTIFVDDSIRKFIVDGLLRASEHRKKSTVSAVNVLSAPPDITQMRERKSDTELQILKCANEATLLAIREVHKNLYPGIRESQARNMMASTLNAAGLTDGGCLTLFGENAALPHGSGTDRTLSKSDFALFDCTASLHGYYSDVTRTVAISSKDLSSEQLHIWRTVQASQSLALAAATNGTLTAAVDGAARTYFKLEGYAKYFTHRLGHGPSQSAPDREYIDRRATGIGLEVHEPPYLRGGSNVIIQTGHTFSDEPGIYIEGKYGVRLEDCFHINESGFGEYLTQGVGGQSSDPWNP